MREVWGRLVRGASLDGLGLPIVDGRVEIRGFSVPAPVVAGQANAPAGLGADVNRLGGIPELRHVRWSRLAFLGGSLAGLRIHGARVENCVFSKTKCRDIRMWSTVVVDSVFQTVDLRGSALGGIEEGRRNRFERVVFDKADLRDTAYVSADFVSCRFANARLAKVDFQGCVFENTSFEGELEEVLFYKHAFQGESLPPNEMRGTDFRRAALRQVEFRELDLDDVKWPEDSRHLVLDDYVGALSRVLAGLQGREDSTARMLRSLVSMMLKWKGMSQHRGVVSMSDLEEAAGEEGIREFMRLAGV